MYHVMFLPCQLNLVSSFVHTHSLSDTHIHTNYAIQYVQRCASIQALYLDKDSGADTTSSKWANKTELESSPAVTVTVEFKL